MKSFDRRVSVADVRPNWRLYPVFSVSGSVASVEEPIVVMSPPFQAGEGKESLLVIDGNGKQVYLSDWNVKDAPNFLEEQYNFHALFRSLEDAESYAADINQGNLGDLEAARNKMVKARQVERENEDDQW